MFETILVPLDGSEQSEAALVYAKAVGGAHSSQLILYRAREPIYNYGQMEDYIVLQQIVDDEVQNVGDYLEAQRRKLEAEGVKVTVLTDAQPAGERILSLAETHNVNLIVMSSHSRSGIRNFVLGSTAERVVRHASCAVLVVGHKAISDLAHQRPIAALTGSHPVHRTMTGSIPL